LKLLGEPTDLSCGHLANPAYRRGRPAWQPLSFQAARPPARIAYATTQSKVDEALAASRASRGGIEFYGYS